MAARYEVPGLERELAARRHYRRTWRNEDCATGVSPSPSSSRSPPSMHLGAAQGNGRRSRAAACAWMRSSPRRRTEARPPPSSPTRWGHGRRPAALRPALPALHSTNRVPGARIRCGGRHLDRKVGHVFITRAPAAVDPCLPGQGSHRSWSYRGLRGRARPGRL
jgi:hypothetical protein